MDEDYDEYADIDEDYEDPEDYDEYDDYEEFDGYNEELIGPRLTQPGCHLQTGVAGWYCKKPCFPTLTLFANRKGKNPVGGRHPPT